MIRGHHIYKSVWTPFIGEELVLEAEDGNEHAVAVMVSCVVGHVPRCISRVSRFFLKRGGGILCRITGKRNLGVSHVSVRMH